MGHATRFLALVLLIAGAVAFARYFTYIVGSTSETAPLPWADPAAAGSRLMSEPPTAVFTAGPRGSPNSELRIEYLGNEPYFAGALRDAISVEVGTQEDRHSLTPDAKLTIQGESYRVAKLRAWQGLLPVSDGATMASISLSPSDSGPVEDILLRAGQRLDVSKVCSVEIRECRGRDEALARIAAELREKDTGRWGIVDTTGVIWFEGFVPGAGATLMDGSLVTLESFDPSGPTLIVRKRTRESSETLRVQGPTSDPPVLLEFGRGNITRLTLYVFEDGHALVSVDDHDVEPKELAAGEMWEVPGGRLRLRLEQILLSAAPVEAAESPFFEAVLETGDHRVRVRQGEAVRVGDALLRYVRAPNNASAAFLLRVVLPAAGPTDIELVPGGAYDFEWSGAAWRIFHSDIVPGERITIRRAGRPDALLIAGVAFIAAAFCLFWVGPRRAPN